MRVGEQRKVGSRLGYLPFIDGLRALAVVAVIINHFSEEILPAGYLGVDIFFVISGFVITSSLLSQPQKGLGGFIFDFYRRRLKRLTPALLVFVACASVLIALFNPAPESDINTGIAAILGLSNVLLYLQTIDYWGHSAALNPFTHTWSLGVEEQFYLIFPPLVWLASSRRWAQVGNRFLAWSIAILSLASLTGFIYLSETRPAAAFYLMPYRFWELGAGCLLSLFTNHKAGSGGNPGQQTSTMLVIIAIVAVLFLPPDYAVQATLAVVVLTVLLIRCLRPGTIGHLVFTHPAVVYVGLISYSLYLWHWGVLVIGRWANGIDWLTEPVQLVAIIVLSVSSYHLVEQPLRYSKWFSHVGKGLGLIAALLLLVMVPLVLSVGVRSGSLYLGESYVRLKSLETAVAKHVQCGSAALQADEHTRTIRVIGDSHSRHIMPMLELIADKCGFAVIGTKNRSGLVFPSGEGHNDRRIDRVLKPLSRGDILILSSRNRYLYASPYLNGPGDQWIDHSEIKSNYGFGLGKWLLELDQIISKASKKGVSVVLFLPNIEFDMPIPLGRTCHQEWFRNPPRLCNATVSSEYLAKRFPEQYYQEIAARVERHGNFHAFNPMPIFCGEGQQKCARQLEGFNAFKDTNHLTQEGSLLMLEEFNAFLIRDHLLR